MTNNATADYDDRIADRIRAIIDEQTIIAALAAKAKAEGLDPVAICRVAAIKARDSAKREAEKIKALVAAAEAAGVQLELGL